MLHTERWRNLQLSVASPEEWAGSFITVSNQKIKAGSFISEETNTVPNKTTGLDLGFGNKLIKIFPLQKQSGPLKKKFKSHHRKPKNFKKTVNGK